MYTHIHLYTHNAYMHIGIIVVIYMPDTFIVHTHICVYINVYINVCVHIHGCVTCVFVLHTHMHTDIDI